MTQRKMLTIAIPTYNRKKELTRLLTHLEKELAGNYDFVSVLIADNHSTDGTEQEVGEFVKRNIDWQAIRQPSNMGMDRNFLTSFLNSQTRYIWILGDDDLPRKGLITLVVEYLTKEQPTLLYLNSQWRDAAGPNDLPSMANIAPISSRAEDYAKKINIWTTFLSAWIIDSYALKENGIGINDISRGIGSSLIQLGWILPLIQESSRLSAVDEACIIATSGNTGGYQLIRTFAVNYPDIVNRIFADKPRIRKALIAPFIKEYLPGLIKASRSGQFNRMLKEPNPLPAAIARLGLYKEFWLHAFPAFMLPTRGMERQCRTTKRMSICRRITSGPKMILSPIYRILIRRLATDVSNKLQESEKKLYQDNVTLELAKLAKAGRNISLPSDVDLIGHECLSIGSDFRAERGLRLHCWKTETFDGVSSPSLEVGDRVFFNREAYVSCAKSIKIGNNTLFGSNVLITDNYHGSTKIVDTSRLSSPLSCPGSIIIENGVWVGNNVCILPGSKIGQGSIIGANSVVNSIIPPFSIAAGVPARVVSTLAEPE